MAVKLNEPIRICKILTSGPVAVLGGISGPINKCKLTNKQIVSIMRSGHKVAEYNPDGSGRAVELTLENNGISPFTQAAPKLKETPKTKKSVENQTPVKEPVKESVPEPVVEIPPVEENVAHETEEVVELSEEENVAPDSEEEAVESISEETEGKEVADDEKEGSTHNPFEINVTTPSKNGNKKSKKSGKK